MHSLLGSCCCGQALTSGSWVCSNRLMDAGVITVFHMSHLAKVAFSGHVSGGFFHCLGFRSGVSTGEGLVSWCSRPFTIWIESKTSHMCLYEGSESPHWKGLDFVTPQNLQGTRKNAVVPARNGCLVVTHNCGRLGGGVPGKLSQQDRLKQSRVLHD